MFTITVTSSGGAYVVQCPKGDPSTLLLEVD